MLGDHQTQGGTLWFLTLGSFFFFLVWAFGFFFPLGSLCAYADRALTTPSSSDRVLS